MRVWCVCGSAAGECATDDCWVCMCAGIVLCILLDWNNDVHWGAVQVHWEEARREACGDALAHPGMAHSCCPERPLPATAVDTRR